jgi:peptide/nickel transport system substrate-binding protein
MGLEDGWDEQDAAMDGMSGTTREEFLKRAGATGLALGAAGGLAGCLGGDDDDGESDGGGDTRAQAENLPQGGNLRVGILSTGTGDVVDPHVSHSSADAARQFAMYDSLTQVRGSTEVFDPTYELAEEMEPNAKGDVWTIRLRKGVEFHNGKTLGVEDFIATYNRITDPKTGSFNIGRWLVYDIKAAKKLDKRTIRVPLTRPQGILPEMMGAGSIANIIPEGFDVKNPVGTGPFRLTSFTPGRETVFERFENYWGEPAKVDTLRLVALADDTARYNALLSGQIDVLDTVPLAQIEGLEGNPEFKVSSLPSAQWYPIYMRVDRAPFEDVRVRQALRLCVDRQQVVDTAYHGHATVGNDIYAKYDPDQDKTLKREQDIEQAKSLLRQAGQENLTVEMVTGPIAPGALETTQVLAENAKAAGITLNLRQTDLGTMYGPNYGKWPFGIDQWPGLPYLVMMASYDTPVSPVNMTHNKDERHYNLYQQATAEVDRAKRKELSQELQGIDFEEGGTIVAVHPNSTAAYSTKVGGFYPANLTGGAVSAGYLDKLGFLA